MTQVNQIRYMVKELRLAAESFPEEDSRREAITHAIKFLEAIQTIKEAMV